MKSYDVDTFDVNDDNDLYYIAVEVLARGLDEDKAWVYQQRTREQLRKLFVLKAGLGMGEDVRRLIRRELDLTTSDLPERASSGW